MNQLPIPTSTEFELAERESVLSQTPASVESSQPSSATDLLTVLREAVADSANPPEAIFRAIADAARVLTDAHGTAIALRTGAVVVCRARSGEIAPELGSALNVESGISGECFRTSTALRCDDTEIDSRVEPEVCRLLGIRSIAVVPLRGPAGVIGILEAFSSDAKTFADGQITFLEKLGEIAEAAYQRQSNQVSLTPVAPNLLLAGSELAIASVARDSVARDREISLATLEEPAPKVRRHYWILAGALAMMLLASGVVWWKWRGMAAENTPSQPTAPVQTVPGQTAEAAAPKVFPLKPSASIANQQADRSRGKGLLQNAAKVEEERNADIARPGNNVAARNITPVISAGGSVSGPGASRAAVEPPVVVLATANNGDGLTEIASATGRLPELDVKVSQGVTAGSIMRKVEPVYPRDALAKRLGGPVKLEASVAEDGTVGDVKVLQGEPMLAAAAVAAVRQWRYSPSLLNGKPIPVLKDITVIFKP